MSRTLNGALDRPLVADVARLQSRGLLTDAQARFLGRVARGELISVRRELQLALWIGVGLIAGGAGLLVKESLGRLGPATVALGLGLAAALCLAHVARSSPPFSWRPVASPTLSFDYVLLLGVLLLGSELAYLEARFRILGPQWPRHLLLLATIQLAFAVRYDSRAVLSLALASFAAWRGVALSFPSVAAAGDSGQAIRLNALVVGAVFSAVGSLLARSGRKAHFEPAFGNLGLMLLLGATVSGAWAGGASAPAWSLALAAGAAATVVRAYGARRVDYFAQGVLAAYLGFLRLAAELRFGAGLLSLVAAGSFGALLLILLAHRRFKGGA